MIDQMTHMRDLLLSLLYRAKSTERELDSLINSLQKAESSSKASSFVMEDPIQYAHSKPLDLSDDQPLPSQSCCLQDGDDYFAHIDYSNIHQSESAFGLNESESLQDDVDSVSVESDGRSPVLLSRYALPLPRQSCEKRPENLRAFRFLSKAAVIEEDTRLSYL